MTRPPNHRGIFSSRLFWKLSLACAALNFFIVAVFAFVRAEWFWVVAAVVALAALGLAYWLIGHVIRPLDSIIQAAEAMAAGNYAQRVYVANRDELGLLARTFNRMSQELHGRMTQLRETSERQSTVLEGMIEGVIAVDPRQRILFANRAAGRLLEFRPPTAEGRPLLEVVRNHAVHEAVTSALATCRPQRLETKSNVQLPSANIQHVDVHVQPLPGEPCPGVVLVMHDTTDLRRLESLRRDFIANVSHELKTPLTSIKAYTETLRNGAMNDPQTRERFLARIEEQSDRLHHLIIDMLMLARIESDQQAFDIVPVDVGELVASCFEHQRPAAEAKRIRLAAKPDQPTCRVLADYEGLREILDNLMDNAIKYTPEGGEVVVAWSGEPPRGYPAGRQAAGARSEERGARNIQHPASSIEHQAAEHPATSAVNGMVHIAVRDTGIGIKPEDQRRVFERFYRVDKARSREVGGTGLGLAIVKHLAQSFDGRVGVESEVGQGSTFWVELPSA
jgi:two-component system phosphate regulon sensor histidine kinase PhoR